MDLVDYWIEYPPPHLLFRTWMGYESPKKDKRLDEMTDEDRDAALDQLFSLGG